MLAGQRSARVHAVRQDLGRDFDRLLRLTGNPLVVADERMQVAVACMEDIADTQSGPLLERANPPEDLGQLGARDHAVLHVVVRRHASHRGERRLASLPDPLALRLIFRHFHREGAGLLAQRFDDGEELVDF